MKRLMMMVAMMAFVLLLPMNAEAAGETVIEGDWVIDESTSLEADTIVNGDVYVNSFLKLEEGTLQVNGNVYVDETGSLFVGNVSMTCTGDVYVEGEVSVYHDNFDFYNPVYTTLIVEGNYTQAAGMLVAQQGGEVCIGKDFRLQSVAENGVYTTGTGTLWLMSDATKLRIGSDLIIDTTVSNFNIGFSTIYVAGDINQISRTVFKPNYLILNGTEPQNINLPYNTSTMGDDPLINTVELTQERKYYTFNPDPCWHKLIQLEGIRNTAEGFKYYEDGNWISDAYKYVEYDGATFLVANGVVATGVNGIAQDPLNPQDWYFLSGGQVQEQHTGLAEYDGQWFYVENGKLDTTMNQCIEYDGALFMLAEGRIISETSGLVMDPKSGNWYFLADGQAKIEYTGLAFYDETWFYVEKGILAEGFTGKVKYDGQYFNVVNGMVK